MLHFWLLFLVTRKMTQKYINVHFIKVPPCKKNPLALSRNLCEGTQSLSFFPLPCHFRGSVEVRVMAGQLMAALQLQPTCLQCLEHLTVPGSEKQRIGVTFLLTEQSPMACLFSKLMGSCFEDVDSVKMALLGSAQHFESSLLGVLKASLRLLEMCFRLQNSSFQGENL